MIFYCFTNLPLGAWQDRNTYCSNCHCPRYSILFPQACWDSIPGIAPSLFLTSPFSPHTLSFSPLYVPNNWRDQSKASRECYLLHVVLIPVDKKLDIVWIVLRTMNEGSNRNHGIATKLCCYNVTPQEMSISIPFTTTPFHKILEPNRKFKLELRFYFCWISVSLHNASQWVIGKLGRVTLPSDIVVFPCFGLALSGSALIFQDKGP